MNELSIQIQSVLYCNKDKDSIKRTLLSVSNAIRVAREFYNLKLDVTFVYGDASPLPVFTDREFGALQELLSNEFTLKYRFFNENTGSARGHNLLSAETDSQYILIMNPDVKLSTDFFYHILRPLEDDRVGMVEARQTPIEHSKEYDIDTLETKWATTACSLIPRRVFDELGEFDSDSFFLYCDDVDFSWRVRLDGYKVIYQPHAIVFHPKELSVHGKWIASSAEKYYSCLASMIIAHKWSNPKLAKSLMRMFAASADENEKKAAKAFEKMKADGKLPKPVDPQHTVCEFKNGFYCSHRFVMPVEE